ncbi:MAG: MarR family transcriptional regulator [Gemmatimonadaceae bacterium]|nr:MarR family transcriptional regulator [Gemmatimonadaceae bacterium]
MDALRRLVRVLSASARTTARGASISGAQLFLLRQIAAAPGLSISELAARTLAGQSTISEVMARLVERRLVVRATHADDARRSALTLTRTGRALVARHSATAQERLLLGLAAMTDAERWAVAGALEQWLERAGYGDVPAAMFFEADGRAPLADRREDSRPRKRRLASGGGGGND